MANLQRIKDIADRRKISIRELADRVGIKENQVHVMCRTNSTKIDTLERIAQVLDVNITEFFDENKASIHTGNYSPVSDSGDISLVVGDAVLQERIKSLEDKVKDRDERLKEKDERISRLENDNAELNHKLIAAQERIIKLMEKEA